MSVLKAARARLRHPELKPCLTFRVRPFAKRRFVVVVNVWESKREMVRHAKAWPGNTNNERNTGAYCRSYLHYDVPKRGRARLLPDFAEVNFHRGQLGTETLTHELFHATMALVDRLKIGPQLVKDGSGGLCSEAEEDAAYAHGRMCRLVVNRLYRAKLIA